MGYLANLKKRWADMGGVRKLAVLSALVLLVLTFAAGLLRREVIDGNVYFCGVSIGGLSRAEAAKIVSEKIEEMQSGSIVFVAGRREVRVEARDIELVVDKVFVEKQLEKLTEKKPAFVPGFFWRLGPRTVMAASAQIGNSRPTEVLERIARELSCPPEGTRYGFKGRDLVILLPEPGQVVTPEDVRQALAGVEGPRITVRYTEIPAPPPTDLPELTLLAEWSTRYDPEEKDRTVNLVLSARAVHGTVLKPGEVFSFNETVGPRTAERGYRYAPVVVGDHMEPDIGGGICQVSTTLFNAAALAGMEFREWRNHGIPVKYADPGRDAGVAWGYMDLRIRNNLSGPVVFGVWVEDGMVVARVYGPPSRYHYELLPVVVAEHPEEGKRPGLVVETYRLKKEGSTVVSREFLKTCVYIPSAEEGK